MPRIWTVFGILEWVVSTLQRWQFCFNFSRSCALHVANKRTVWFFSQISDRQQNAQYWCWCFPKSPKHSAPVSFNCFSPFYLTYNFMPVRGCRSVLFVLMYPVGRSVCMLGGGGCVCRWTARSVGRWVSRSVDVVRSVGRSVSGSVVRSFAGSVGGSVGRWIGRAVVRSFDWSVGGRVGRTVDRSFDRLVGSSVSL